LDDDDDLRASLAEVLREEGYDVSEAATTEAALARVHGGPRIDVVVSDRWGPAGVDLVAELQAAESLSIVVFTGADVVPGDPMRLKATAVVRKPSTPELLAAIRKATT
jgi:CheY-like chemotaxis protein